MLEFEVQAIKEIQRDQKLLIEKLDQRQDRSDIIQARLLAGLAVLMFLGQLVAPVVLKLAGIEH